MKKILGLVVVGAGAIAAIAYLTRDQLLPAPALPREEPPKFRTGGSNVSDLAAEDLTEIKGIGPAYAARLTAMSISTRSELAAADAQVIADSISANVATVEGWQAEASR